MTTPNKLWFAIAACVVLGGCADDKGFKIEQAPGPTELPQVSEPGMPGTAVSPGGNVGPRQLNYTAESDLAWTNPDDLDAGIPELEVLMAAPKRGPWEESETIARQT